MAGDNLNVWYDPEGDHLEIVFDQKAGYFEDTSLENVMRKRDAEGNLLAISIFNVSSFAGTRPYQESTSGHDLWAVFNLGIDDPDSFEFDVALGHERLGEEEPDPESPSVSIAGPDACARCSVFFHADRSRPRLVEGTLETVHKPMSPPVASIGSDPLSPVSLTSMCRDQLVLALRLFQPQSFLMFPRERRREGRARAYLALVAHQAGPPAPYVLQGGQVTRFLEFARKLRAFHVDRNLYRGIRRDPLGRLLLSNDQDEAAFLKRVAGLMIAADLFEQANEAHAFSGEMRLLWLVMAAEALFTDDAKRETSSHLATRMARLNAAGAEDVNRHEELVRSIYKARNKLMHGTAYVGTSKQLPGLVGDTGFIEPTPERLLAFNNLVRASILYFIAFQDVERRDILRILDRSASDPSDLARLRGKANEYWGLMGREDEVLCSGRWVA